LTGEKRINLALIVDDKLSPEKLAQFTRKIDALKQSFNIDLFKPDTAEETLLQKIQGKDYALVFAPMAKYLAWHKAEAHFGLNRTSGPGMAGYFCEGLKPETLRDQAGQLRRIAVDFTHITAQELLILLRCMSADQRRSGLRSLLDPQALIYCENWYSAQGLGARMDVITALPEVAKGTWAKRGGAIRVTLTALWSLVYEEGSGKVDLAAQTATKTPRAYFQMGADANTLVFRLFYNTMQRNPKEAIKIFWPDATNATHPAQLLLKFADFVRVHTIADHGEMELTVGFFNSAPSNTAFEQLHTIWIDPISPNLITEPPYEAPSPQAPHLRAFPNFSLIDNKPKANDDPNAHAKERFIVEASNKIRDLKKLVEDKEHTIRELRSGGIGTAPPLPPPDAEGLLDAFQQKYFEARLQIRQFEVQIDEMSKKGATPKDIEILKQKMAVLTQRHQNWIRKLMATLESSKKAASDK